MKNYKTLGALPDQWCIERTPETCAEVNTIFSKIYNKGYTHNGVTERSSSNYLHYPPLTNRSYKGRVVFTYPLRDYTIITVEEYKKLIMETKKLIGYKLKFAEYDKAALKIGGFAKWCMADGIDFGANDTRTVQIFEEVGLLDKWFEKVYEAEPELPVITHQWKQYTGEIKGDNVVYGCAELCIDWFRSSSNRHIASFKTSNGVTVNEGDIVKIKKYLKHHGL